MIIVEQVKAALQRLSEDSIFHTATEGYFNLITSLQEREELPAQLRTDIALFASYLQALYAGQSLPPSSYENKQDSRVINASSNNIKHSNNHELLNDLIGILIKNKLINPNEDQIDQIHIQSVWQQFYLQSLFKKINSTQEIKKLLGQFENLENTNIDYIKSDQDIIIVPALLINGQVISRGLALSKTHGLMYDALQITSLPNTLKLKINTLYQIYRRVNNLYCAVSIITPRGSEEMTNSLWTKWERLFNSYISQMTDDTYLNRLDLLLIVDEFISSLYIYSITPHDQTWFENFLFYTRQEIVSICESKLNIKLKWIFTSISMDRNHLDNNNIGHSDNSLEPGTIVRTLRIAGPNMPGRVMYIN